MVVTKGRILGPQGPVGTVEDQVQKINKAEQLDTKDQESHEARNKLIGDQVLSVLGEPPDLLQVQVRRLWEGHYRVNVFVRADILSTRVVASYFLQTDQHGQITAATPELVKGNLQVY